MSNDSSKKAAAHAPALPVPAAPGVRHHAQVAGAQHSKSAPHGHSSASPKPPNWGPAWGILATVLVYVSAQVIAVIMWIVASAAAPHLHGSTAWIDATWAQFVYVAGSEALGLYVVWRFLRWRKSGWPSIGVMRPHFKDASYALIGFGAYFLAYAFVIGVVNAFIHIDTSQQQDVGFSTVHGAPQLILTFVSLVILPPIVEEITFRGVLFSGFRTKLKFLPAALATSVLFGAPHLLEAKSGGALWVAGIDTFVLSMVLCYMREKTGRVWAGMGIHALKNGLAFVTLFIISAH